MKGAIIVPTFYRQRHFGGVKSQRSRYLLGRLSMHYGFPLIYTDAPALDKYDVALIYAVPYHNRPGIPKGLLDTKTKLIGYFEDLACWGNLECKKNKNILFNRYDLLMGACYASFEKHYSQFMSKYVHYPNFYFPAKRYNQMNISGKRKMKCLMAGMVNGYYPFRQFIAQKRKREIIDVIRVTFDRYPPLLASYFCAIAVPGRLRNVVAKYLEIPAAGTLLLAERLKELDIMGLKPDIHYIPITKENVFEQVRKVLTTPEKFITIKDRGTRFVRKKHSEMNRVALFKEVLRRLDNG